MNADKPQLEFPLVWQGKVIGLNNDDVLTGLRNTLLALGLDQPVARTRNSSGGNYATYEMTVVFLDRNMMTEVTTALSVVEGVKLVL